MMSNFSFIDIINKDQKTIVHEKNFEQRKIEKLISLT